MNARRPSPGNPSIPRADPASGTKGFCAPPPLPRVMSRAPAGPAIHDLQAVQERRREKQAEAPPITLTARASLGGLANVRVTARPVVGAIADSAGPRLELHAEGGTSVVIEGKPLLGLVLDSVKFLRNAATGGAREHDHAFGLTVAFDLATSPFVTLEPPPFLVATARTVIHESGAVALRLVGEDRPLVRGPEHAPVRPGERVTNASFELQVASRDGKALLKLLEGVLADLGPQEDGPAHAGGPGVA